MSMFRDADGWSLVIAREPDIDGIMTWFPDATATATWAGPSFRFPFTRHTFHEDCLWKKMATYALKSPDNALAGFGQLYNRFDKINMARLVVAPDIRGQGAGKRLISLLMEVGRETFELEEFSLFVFRHNTPALECYRAMGFEIREYPQGAPLAELCYYLTRPVSSGGE